MASILEKFLHFGEGKFLKKLRNYVTIINALEAEYREMSDEEISSESENLKLRAKSGENIDDLLPEAFALVREATDRVLGMRHFDVQLMGGVALHFGNVSEMKTGEGKTLVALAPAFLNALSGKSVHIITVNDYLAQYQGELMSRVFKFLGMSTGIIVSNQDPAVRKKQYLADITYGTNNEFGFDYLRDNMSWKETDLVQRNHDFAIVDEVDSILIDEARTPLIISGPASGDANRWYQEFAKISARLFVDKDYEIDEKKKTVGVLDSGIEKVEDYLGISNLYESVNTPLIGFLNNAIKAKELFKRDKDYVVLKGEVLIVDEHTGRILAGRRYNEGMHQAIEAKEKVEIKAENQTLATITLQNYFRLYKKLSGMTGTAETEAAELMSTYKLGVVPIPTHRPVQRLDKTDLIYKNETAKYSAVVADVLERYNEGQPVLIGTASVEKSEYISVLLSKEGIKHEVLNAKNHAREAAIIAQAGRKKSVTVATNMAGRGTDILLGGNPEIIASTILAEKGLVFEKDPDAYNQAWVAALENAKKQVSEEREEVVNLGGLYVLGTERHESRRIDNQLRGRSGRQGDPGESRFYLSLQDDLMRLFNSGAAEAMMVRAPDDMPLEAKLVSRAIASAQSQVEGRNAEQRKNVLKYDDVLNRQRSAIYEDRRQILNGEDIHEKVQYFLEDVIKNHINVTASEDNGEGLNLETLWSNLKLVYPISITVDEIIEEAASRDGVTIDLLEHEIVSDAKLAYQDREAKLGSESMRQLERQIVLSVIDRKWREHLYEMDYLKEGIGLRAMAQRDPLVEYQREGYFMFQTMTEAIREEVISYLYNVEVEVSDSSGLDSENKQDAKQIVAKGSEAPKEVENLQFSAPAEDGSTSTVVKNSGVKKSNKQNGVKKNKKRK